ncbi:hypothetical protein BABINDRAFT_8677 [Babjeviella inositovora NRRL Y-12698]|uniref:2-dehydropantolactone reductase n=1 Tax=Babjeviella inositovora NRRL Y-12698 TaxID=984486 RepID=A0A1E3QN54_9ASCO|nr:uncharacterized protein BABINDRAFT_8677 [Babjeviella inositovora NRRL Y-12698]ODQ79068.1 hypothetical protein BABINDRAFT_8677 [Babjeviella inositovora NRRL Y-12698]
MGSVRDNFKTKSGDPLTIGVGSGTKWQWLKKARSEDEKDQLVEPLVTTILSALEQGFNHVDTAEMYTTHEEVGEALRRAGYLTDEKAREKVWITDKYYPGGFFTQPPFTESTTASIDVALQKIGTNYLDLYLLHTPFFDPTKTSTGLAIKDIWQQMEQAVRDGKVRYIGVSNFAASHIEEILSYSTIKPVVNQIEFHPFLQEQSPGIAAFCAKNDILIETYSPLAPLFRDDSGKLNETLDKIGAKYQKNNAQVLLRYVMEKGHLPITTSSKAERFKEAMEIHSFELSKEDVALISEEGAKHHFRAFFADERFLSTSKNVQATVARSASSTFAEYRSKQTQQLGPLYSSKTQNVGEKSEEFKRFAEMARSTAYNSEGKAASVEARL